MDNAFACRGVGEREQCRVQAEARGESQEFLGRVEIVAKHRVTDRQHVQPQLM